MQQVLYTFRTTNGYTKYEHPGPTVTAVAASAALTNAAYDSGWVELETTAQIPKDGMTLEINYPPGITGTGAGTTGTYHTWTVTFADGDTPTLVNSLSHVSARVGLTFDGAGALAAVNGATANLTNVADAKASGFVAYLRIPESRHRWVKVAKSADTLGASITAVAYGVVGVGLVTDPDSEAPNTFDIG